MILISHYKDPYKPMGFFSRFSRSFLVMDSLDFTDRCLPWQWAACFFMCLGLVLKDPWDFFGCICFTPWKINMEPTNHPFRKENDLPNLHDYVPC